VEDNDQSQLLLLMGHPASSEECDLNLSFHYYYFLEISDFIPVELLHALYDKKASAFIIIIFLRFQFHFYQAITCFV